MTKMLIKYQTKAGPEFIILPDTDAVTAYFDGNEAVQSMQIIGELDDGNVRALHRMLSRAVMQIGC